MEKYFNLDRITTINFQEEIPADYRSLREETIGEQWCRVGGVSIRTTEQLINSGYKVYPKSSGKTNRVVNKCTITLNFNSDSVYKTFESEEEALEYLNNIMKLSPNIIKL